MTLFRSVLVAAAYEGVEFPCVDAHTDGGHASVEHTAYRRRGADIEPTGQEPYGGTLTIPLLNDIGLGELFPGRYYDLLRVFEARPLGTLSHPTKGTFTAHIKNWKEKLEAVVQNGLTLEVSWREHVASAGLLLADLGSLADAPAQTQARAAVADTAMAAADPTGTYTPARPVIDAQLAAIEGTAVRYATATAALRTMLALIDANMALPAFAGVAGYPAVAALAALRASVVTLRSRYLPETSRIRTYTTAGTMADWQVAAAVYGDARYAPLIRQANSVPDFLAIPPGTRLVILPNDGA